MSEFEDKLQSILGDPQAMNQIMSLAQSITGNSSEPSSAEDPQPPVSSASSDLGSLFPALGSLDPRIIQLGMRLLSEYQSTDEKKVALLTAMQPFIKQQRAEKMEQAIRIAKLSRVIRIALDSFRSRGEEYV